VGALSGRQSAERRVSWHVYIVRCADRTLYTGVAKDLRGRIAVHNSGRGAKYTRQRLPVKLVYSETAADRGAALRRELEIKRLPRAEKRALFATSRASSRPKRSAGRRAG
jgi:predicted GIY-YIG superfamily endonuclease